MSSWCVKCIVRRLIMARFIFEKKKKQQQPYDRCSLRKAAKICWISGQCLKVCLSCILNEFDNCALCMALCALCIFAQFLRIWCVFFLRCWFFFFVCVCHSSVGCSFAFFFILIRNGKRIFVVFCSFAGNALKPVCLKNRIERHRKMHQKSSDMTNCLCVYSKGV